MRANARAILRATLRCAILHRETLPRLIDRRTHEMNRAIESLAAARTSPDERSDAARARPAQRRHRDLCPRALRSWYRVEADTRTGPRAERLDRSTGPRKPVGRTPSSQCRLAPGQWGMAARREAPQPGWRDSPRMGRSPPWAAARWTSWPE